MTDASDFDPLKPEQDSGVAQASAAVNKPNRSPLQRIKRAGLWLLVITFGPLFALILAFWGHGLWWDFQHKPYDVDDRYRWECPSAPMEFDYQPHNLARRDGVVKMGPYTLRYPNGLSAAGSPVYSRYPPPHSKTPGKENLVIDSFGLLYPRMWPAGDARFKPWEDNGVHRISIQVGYNPDGRPFKGSDEIRRTEVSDLAIPFPKLGLNGFKGTGPAWSHLTFVFRPINSEVKAAPGYDLKLVAYSGFVYPDGPEGHGGPPVVLFPIRDDLWVKYSFFPHYLPCWQQIHDAVYRRIDSIIEENE